MHTCSLCGRVGNPAGSDTTWASLAATEQTLNLESKTDEGSDHYPQPLRREKKTRALRKTMTSKRQYYSLLLPSLIIKASQEEEHQRGYAYGAKTERGGGLGDIAPEEKSTLSFSFICQCWVSLLV